MNSSAQRTPDPQFDQREISARRRGPCRRRNPTPMLSKYLFRGRRRGVRREDESTQGYYVDRFSTFEIAAVIALFVLTVADAVATLNILGRGGIELNPLMRAALEVGNHYFLLSKLGISLVGAFLILIHARYPGVRRALWALLGLYASVVVYHGYLIFKVLTRQPVS